MRFVRGGGRGGGTGPPTDSRLSNPARLSRLGLAPMIIWPPTVFRVPGCAVVLLGPARETKCGLLAIYTCNVQSSSILA